MEDLEETFELEENTEPNAGFFRILFGLNIKKDKKQINKEANIEDIELQKELTESLKRVNRKAKELSVINFENSFKVKEKVAKSRNNDFKNEGIKTQSQIKGQETEARSHESDRGLEIE